MQSAVIKKNTIIICSIDLLTAEKGQLNFFQFFRSDKKLNIITIKIYLILKLLLIFNYSTSKCKPNWKKFKFTY